MLLTKDTERMEGIFARYADGGKVSRIPSESRDYQTVYQFAYRNGLSIQELANEYGYEFRSLRQEQNEQELEAIRKGITSCVLNGRVVIPHSDIHVKVLSFARRKRVKVVDFVRTVLDNSSIEVIYDVRADLIWSFEQNRVDGSRVFISPKSKEYKRMYGYCSRLGIKPCDFAQEYGYTLLSYTNIIEENARKMSDLIDKGMSYRSVAKRFDCTHQRVWQLVQEYRYGAAELSQSV